MKSLFVAAALAVSVSAAEPNRATNTVILDETAVQNLRLETVEATPSEFPETVFALGRIRVAPGHRAIVSSRVPGRVRDVAAHIDLPIKKDAEAIVLESRLPGDPPPVVRLTAPISGFVAAVNVAPGQPVSPDDSLIEIVDLDEVHAVAIVPDHQAGKLKVGQHATLKVPSFPDREFPATLEHIAAQADSQSNALEATFHVENPELVLRPGMRAEFSIVVAKRDDVTSIPRVALQGDPTNRFVYIADYELKHAYVKTPVVIGAQSGDLVEITQGLLAGDQVVTRGAYSLAFAGKGSISLKDAMDAAHGHPHNEDGSEISTDQKGAAHEHAGEHAPSSNLWTWFFAGTSALLLVMLLVSIATRPRATT